MMKDTEHGQTQFYKAGEPCNHPGCLSHRTHPCEGCGRIAGEKVEPVSIAYKSEPVGEVYRYGKDSAGMQWHGIHWHDHNVDIPSGTKIFTAPPPRTDCASRADGSAVLVPSAELKKMQAEIARLTKEQQQAAESFMAAHGLHNDECAKMQATIAQQAGQIKFAAAIKDTREVENYALHQEVKELTEQLAEAESVIELCGVGLRDWEITESRYAALDAIAAHKVNK